MARAAAPMMASADAPLATAPFDPVCEAAGAEVAAVAAPPDEAAEVMAIEDDIIIEDDMAPDEAADEEAADATVDEDAGRALVAAVEAPAPAERDWPTHAVLSMRE